MASALQAPINRETTNLELPQSQDRAYFQGRTAAIQTNDVLKIQGNIIPEQLYGILLTASGKTNTRAISIYSHIINWYHSKKRGDDRGMFYGNLLKLQYDYLVQKFGCSKETIRREMVFLEKYGLISRIIRPQYSNNEQSGNEVLVGLWKNTEYFICEVGLNKDEISAKTSGAIIGKTAHQILAKHKNVGIIYPHKNVQIYIDNNNKNNNNISRSEDVININECLSYCNSESIASELEPKTVEITNAIECSEPIAADAVIAANDELTATSDCSLKSMQTLKDFLPVNPQECALIRKTTGRNLQDQYINEILQHVSTKTQTCFFSKKSALRYISKVIQHELRSDEIINRFGYEASSAKMIQKRKFLAKMEFSPDPFRRKIAYSFDPHTAYDLLNNSNRITTQTEEVIFYMQGFERKILNDDQYQRLLELANLEYTPSFAMVAAFNPNLLRGKKAITKITFIFDNVAIKDEPVKTKTASDDTNGSEIKELSLWEQHTNELTTKLAPLSKNWYWFLSDCSSIMTINSHDQQYDALYRSLSCSKVALIQRIDQDIATCGMQIGCREKSLCLITPNVQQAQYLQDTYSLALSRTAKALGKKHEIIIAVGDLDAIHTYITAQEIKTQEQISDALKTQLLQRFSDDQCA